MMAIAVGGTDKFDNFYRALKLDDLRKKQIDEAMDFMKKDKQGIGEKIEKAYGLNNTSGNTIFQTYFDIV